MDMELSFVDVDDVIDVNERLLAKLFKEVLDVEVKLPIRRMTWIEAMNRFGSDKPDLRFGMELKDISDIVKRLWIWRIYRRAFKRWFCPRYQCKRTGRDAS